MLQNTMTYQCVSFCPLTHLLKTAIGCHVDWHLPRLWTTWGTDRMIAGATDTSSRHRARCLVGASPALVVGSKDAGVAIGGPARPWFGPSCSASSAILTFSLVSGLSIVFLFLQPRTHSPRRRSVLVNDLFVLNLATGSCVLLEKTCRDLIAVRGTKYDVRIGHGCESCIHRSC
jgi:hypothetical protein